MTESKVLTIQLSDGNTLHGGLADVHHTEILGGQPLLDELVND